MAARIHEGWLFWDDADVVRQRERTGERITPEVIVLHYGVTQTLPELVRAQRARGYWAHLSIDGLNGPTRADKYRIYQALPFDERGSHAGVSNYQGRDQVNSFSIGIEIANPGPVFWSHERERWEDVYDRAYYGHVEELGAPDGYPQNWTHWAHYTDQEYDILIEVCRALWQHYPTIVDVVGHSDIAPGRKFDPGPALNLDYLRSKIISDR